MKSIINVSIDTEVLRKIQKRVGKGNLSKWIQDAMKEELELV